MKSVLLTTEERDQRLLSRKELAARWSCSEKTVRSRTDGKLDEVFLGPRGIRYRLSDIIAYEAAVCRKK